jgi:hypothetical protein
MLLVTIRPITILSIITIGRIRIGAVHIIAKLWISRGSRLHQCRLHPR